MKQISYYLILLLIIAITVVVALNNKSQVYVNGCTRRLTQNSNTLPTSINPVSSQPKSSFNDDLPYLEYFPIYPGATAIEVTCSETSGDEQHQGLPVYRTIKSYEVAATPKQLAEFYVQPVREYGWLFLDTVKYESLEKGYFPATQAGNINEPGDIIFRGAGHGINHEKSVSIGTELSITTNKLSNGKTKVKLKIIESEMPRYPGP